MGEKPGERGEARVRLRNELADGLARAQMDKSRLAVRARLSRTTVHGAFSADGIMPSAATIAALAAALRLPIDELLELRRMAAGEGIVESVRPSGLGRPIGEWDPHDLEVHPAGLIAIGPDQRCVLPGYVTRGHDRVLASAVQDAAGGNSRMVVLVGSSSTGKTRACWEAVQPLAAEGWRLWHPFDPTRAEAALDDLVHVAPRTVVWLNEAQHYLGQPQAGERIAAALHALLSTPGRGPVLVLGTLWSEYADQYTHLPEYGAPDLHSRVRELLAGRTLIVPDTFDPAALRVARSFARNGDHLLADALARTGGDGRITQDLAGAPELLRRYEFGTPAAKALLEAAMDARRLGIGVHIPQAFLMVAATDYLTDHDYDQLTEDWAEAAFTELARPVHGKHAPLRRANSRPARRPPGDLAPNRLAPLAGPVFRLADYLEQYGRTTRRMFCPPASFWHAAHTHLAHAEDLHNLSTAARQRHRLQWSHHLLSRAADAGHPNALVHMAIRRGKDGDRPGAEGLFEQAADAGDPYALSVLVAMREEAGDRKEAKRLVQRAIDIGHAHVGGDMAMWFEQRGEHDEAEAMSLLAAVAGSPHSLFILAMSREKAGDRERAEALVRRAVNAGALQAATDLARQREAAGDWSGAEGLYRLAADSGAPSALLALVTQCEKAGDRKGAEALARQATGEAYLDVLICLGELRQMAGDREAAELLYQEAASAGAVRALDCLATARERAGDHKGAELLAQQAADGGDPDALIGLGELRQVAGKAREAEALYRRAADAGAVHALDCLASMREAAGDHEGAEALALEAAVAGDVHALLLLVQLREEAGDQKAAEAMASRAAIAGYPSGLIQLAEKYAEIGNWSEAEALYRQAAESGSVRALVVLAARLNQQGSRADAEFLYRQAADAGDTAIYCEKTWPFGLDPDGSPTSPWK
ncbi:hypothetical protein [Streptomyces sp. NPDC097981]|uniref:tetratricopeptide repeat protein n=1 Tax=Streptomyces sp. NPDC097981 TaxID=3155428 RepID=UPI0033255441